MNLNRAERLASSTEAADAERRARVQHRTLRVVVASQVLGGAGLAAGIAVGALLAEQMLGSESLAGLPIALFTLGSAVAAFVVGRSTQHWGRRIGLGLGFAVGGVGALGVVLAAWLSNIPLLFVALLVYGSGTATNLQARYAGTDLALPHQRGSAASIALVSTTAGAVAGPNLVAPTGHLAAAFGLPALAGPFLLAAVAYLAAGGVLMVLLRPDPFLLARELDSRVEARSVVTGSGGVASRAGPTTRGVASEAHRPRVRLGRTALAGATVMVLAQITMVGIMTVTPVHMRAHSFGLSAVGLVIGLHIAGMYLPSPVTGLLVDKVGRTSIAITSGVTLLAAGVVAALAPSTSMGWIILALVLLGLGWNLGLLSGTALVVDGTAPADRGRVQGAVDVLVALAGAGGGAASGVVMSAHGYGTLTVACGVLALAGLPVLLATRGIGRRRHILAGARSEGPVR